jgi:hypothetical protein
MKKTVFAAIALSSLTLAACGGGTTANTSVENVGAVDDLNTTETLDETSFGNDTSLNTGDLNTLGPIDDPALTNGAGALDNTTTNAL